MSDNTQKKMGRNQNQEEIIFLFTTCLTKRDISTKTEKSLNTVESNNKKGGKKDYGQPLKMPYLIYAQIQGLEMSKRLDQKVINLGGKQNDKNKKGW